MKPIGIPCRNTESWRRDTLRAIDNLLDESDVVNREQLRADIWQLVCDQTGHFIDRYRAEILGNIPLAFKVGTD